jgi:hypothetical protein
MRGAAALRRPSVPQVRASGRFVSAEVRALGDSGRAVHPRPVALRPGCCHGCCHTFALAAVLSLPSLRIVDARGGRRLSGAGGQPDRGWPFLRCDSGGPGRRHGAGTCCGLGASCAPDTDDGRHAASHSERIERVHRAGRVVAGRRRHASPSDSGPRAARYRPTAGRRSGNRRAPLGPPLRHR